MKHALQLFLASILIVLLVTLGVSAVIDRHRINGRRQIAYSLTQGSPCLKYISLSRALTSTKQGEPISVHTYSVSDGTKVIATYFYYRSPKKANKELNRKLISAIRTITRETKVDQKGNKIGVRAIGIFRSRASDINEYQLLWTDGSDLKMIRGPSLSHVLQLEKPNCH